jgi:glycosyltransferase involved in cell wall biosynthesis
MRVAYVLPEPELGGGSKVVFQHADLLAAAGLQVTVLGAGPRPAWARLASPYLDYAAGPPRLPSQDLVIATLWSTIATARTLAAGPLAHFCQGYEGGLVHLRPILGEIEAAYAEPLPTLTVTPFLARFVAERFGREAAVAPPSVDPLYRSALGPLGRPLGRPRRRPWIAIPGIFEAEVKDVPTALAAVRRLRREGCGARVLRFSILPLSPAERELLAADRYLCAVPPAAVAGALRRCDLLLFPSRAEEGFGLPLLEAMAARVPAVASRIPSTEYMTGGAVELVEPGDEAAFAAAAGRLLGSPAGWRRARRAGSAAAARFSPAAVAPLVLAAVRWAAGRASRDRPSG